MPVTFGWGIETYVLSITGVGPNPSLSVHRLSICNIEIADNAYRVAMPGHHGSASPSQLLRLAQPIETKRKVWLRGVDLNHRPLGYEPIDG